VLFECHAAADEDNRRARRQLALELDGEGFEAQADPQRLHQALTNFLDNAIKFSPTGGDVHVGAWRGVDEVGVTVTDNGPGIPADARPHVFDRFYKTDPARATPGSGLGLAIALENARLLGGDIDVWSEVGTGTRFTLRLPVTKPLQGRGPGVSRHDDDEERQSEGEEP